MVLLFALRAHIEFGAAICPSIFFTLVVRGYYVANEVQAKFLGGVSRKTKFSLLKEIV